MRYLYLNKFRGFTHTIIPFENVNFLVGENSTGKTSVLALLDIIQNPHFWITNEFTVAGYELGGFEDIVSIADSSAKTFDIGMIQTFIQKKPKKQVNRGFLAKFQEKRGLPFCSFMSEFQNSVMMSIKSCGHTAKFLSRKLPYKNIHNNIREVFSYLDKIRLVNNRFYKELPKIFGGSRRQQPVSNIVMFFPVLSLLSLKDRNLKKQTKDLVGITPLSIIPDTIWFAPIRTKPKRTYDGYDKTFNPEGEHTPYTLRKILAPDGKLGEFKSILENFGKTSGLFKYVKINPLGYATTSAFELLIALKSHPLRIDNVGYGISQILPIVVEIIERPKNTWFALQQPEIHLHPKAQASLGDLLFYLANEENKKFIIETHSDFIIDRFRINMSRKEHDLKAQILFFERKNDRNCVTPIPINKKGVYSEMQQKSFRNFFLREQRQLLEV